MLRFGDFLHDILWDVGHTYTSSSSHDLDASDLKMIKRWINDAYCDVHREMPDEFIRTKKMIQLPAVYDTGTVTISQGSRTVAGSVAPPAVWTAYMQMRQMRIGSDRKVYFIEKPEAVRSIVFSDSYQEADASGETYKIATWAIPLPSDFLCPLSERDVRNASNGGIIRLIDKETFRRIYPYVHQVARPTLCAIDGVTSFGILGGSTLSGTVTTAGTATVTCSESAIPKEDHIGKQMWIEGDSVRYTITGKGSGTWTVAPVVQRSDDSGLAYYIEPPKLPLLWFNSAPSTDLYIELSYGQKPEALWTDEQIIALAVDYEELFKAIASYRVIMKMSSDNVQKQEALLTLQQVKGSMPPHIDTTPIRSFGRRGFDWSEMSVLDVEE